MSDGASRSPRLTVGLPTYNREDYLASALDSILAQTYTDFELIISDNASTDGTERIALEYAARDNRIRYVRHPVNRGSAFNHTFVIREARGEFFKWVADDDLYAPELFELCIAALDARPWVPCAHAWTTQIDENGEVADVKDYVMTTDAASPADRLRTLLYTDGGDDIYGVIRMSVLRTMPDYGTYYHSDRTFVAEVALHGPLYNVPRHLYYRREHSARGGQAALSPRRMCSVLDPARANRWRHPVVRLVAEYLLGYVAAIMRAPLSRADRLRCLMVFAAWIVAHARPSRYEARQQAGRVPSAGQSQPPGPGRTERPAKAVRSVALYGLLGSGNLGNDASLETVLAWFREHAPAVQLSAITIAPSTITARYGIPATPLMALRPDLDATDGHAGALQRMAGRLLDVPRSFLLAGRADAVIVPGMGVLEDGLGVRAWGIPAWLASIAAACRLRGHRFVLLAVGATEIANPLSRSLFHRAVRNAAYVSYRDEDSSRAMRGAARPADLLGTDIAFAHPEPPEPTLQAGLIVIGVMRYFGPDDDPVSGRQIHEHYVAGLVDVVTALVSAGDEIRLVVGDSVDAAVAERVKDLAAARSPQHAAQVTVQVARTFAELTAQMRAAEAVIATRYHNVISGLRLGKPVVSLAYGKKNAWLMDSFGLAHLSTPIERFTASETLDTLAAVRSSYETLHRQITERADQLRILALEMIDDMAVHCLGLSMASRSNPRAIDVVSHAGGANRNLDQIGVSAPFSEGRSL